MPYFGVRNLCKAHTPLIQLCVLILLAALLIAHRPCAAQSATDSAKSPSVTLPPMPADADPAFEVATIKPLATPDPARHFLHYARPSQDRFQRHGDQSPLLLLWSSYPADRRWSCVAFDIAFRSRRSSQCRGASQSIAIPPHVSEVAGHSFQTRVSSQHQGTAGIRDRPRERRTKTYQDGSKTRRQHWLRLHESDRPDCSQFIHVRLCRRHAGRIPGQTGRGSNRV